MWCRANGGDVTATRSDLGQVSRPAILIGHSGGGVITDDRVAGLVYIAAPGPGRRRDLPGPKGQVSEGSPFGNLEVTDGRSWLTPKGASTSAVNCPRRSRS
jgi:pimeloyl-ACP methyl ester carboxylesterase